MKKTVFLILGLILLSCNGENVPDCFQNAGDIIEKEFTVDTFTQITVFERIELIVTEAQVQKVIVQTGEYLMNDIDVRVEDGRLKLYNNNGCNLTRDYGITKVFVSAPNLTQIRNSSGLTVSNQGVLNYDSLELVSEDFNTTEEFHTDGNFSLDVNCNRLEITVNNLSSCFISGQVETLIVGFYSGDARFEGRNLIAQNVTIFQRSSNDMVINAQQSIAGEIRSTGDVILVNTPPTVDIEQFYTGQLLFED